MPWHVLICLDMSSNRRHFDKMIETWNSLNEYYPAFVRSGRSSYIGIQELICRASAGLLKYGGQGNSAPDFWYGDKWGETKSFVPGKTTAHVAASSFFAKNCKVPEHRTLLRTDPIAAKKFLFEHSYDKNDIYCLTGTGENKGISPEEIELIFVDKDLLVSCLTSTSDFKEVNLSKLREIICWQNLLIEL